jgi:hypothetical protein
MALVQPSLYAGRERSRVKSVVVGRPILLALEEIDGSPAFLEKALSFLETYGMLVCFTSFVIAFCGH